MRFYIPWHSILLPVFALFRVVIIMILPSLLWITFANALGIAQTIRSSLPNAGFPGKRAGFPLNRTISSMKRRRQHPTNQPARLGRILQWVIFLFCPQDHRRTALSIQYVAIKKHQQYQWTWGIRRSRTHHHLRHFCHHPPQHASECLPQEQNLLLVFLVEEELNWIRINSNRYSKYIERGDLSMWPHHPQYQSYSGETIII